MKRTLSSLSPVSAPDTEDGNPFIVLDEDELAAFKVHEECGVFGIFRRDPPDQPQPAPGAPGAPAPVDPAQDVRYDTYRALFALQHRGQESCGIAVNAGGDLFCRKDVGLVSEVFSGENLEKMPLGRMAVAHCRYGTTGGKNHNNAQPLLVNHHKGAMALCHNGNLANAADLRGKLEKRGAIFHSTSDSEVLSYVITQQRLHTRSIEEAVRAAMGIVHGAYSLVLMTRAKLIAVRDPHGFRPLCMGHMGSDIVFASESCALDAIGATFDRDLEAGEVVVVTANAVKSYRTDGAVHDGMCVFEYIYFARPDSVIDGASVQEARLRAGGFLALDHPVQADVVIGVPDSGIDAAVGFARQSGIPYGVGFVKNRYIARTFIEPGAQQRKDAVRMKLSAVSSAVKGKRVVMVDDSIVRGTTSARIVSLLRAAGAKEVHVRLSAPPFLYPCHFGTDIDSRDNLIAAQMDLEGVRQAIGADSLGYLAVEDCDKLAVGATCGFCKGCFTGSYPVAPPKSTLKHKFERTVSARE